VLRDQVDGSFTVLDPDAPLTRYGMDSLATAEAAVRMERATGRKIAPDLLAQTQTVREVARLLAGEPLDVTAPHDGEARAERRAPTPKSVPFPQRMAQAMERVNQLRGAGRYPYHRIVSDYRGGTVTMEGRPMLMLGSYEYLNILDHPLRIAAAKKALDEYGTGGKGVPILAGRTAIHVELERRLAKLMDSEDAVVFTGGYITNLATVATFVGPGDLVAGDALNHASIVDGCRYSGARFVTFAHNDLAALQRLLAENAGTHTLVVMEGSFSMDGDIGRMPPV
jgi:glycine C-acetyltransferase